MNNQNLINEVRSKVDIVELISEYLPLTKKGQYYWGVCPFHNDKNPSMSVDTKRQTYNCWSCHASGNVFTFIENIENVSFREALNILANKANVTLTGIRTSFDNENTKLFDIYDYATKFYELTLNTSKGEEAKKYLAKRKIDSDTIKEFGIGLSPNDKNRLLDFLKEKKYDTNTMEDIGLINGDHDTFINRIMFPLQDRNGKTVGFSGRIYDDSKQSKYLNTKETKIFKKGNMLYNYHKCKESVRVSKYVIVMEGFMDVIRAHTIGVKNTVALMGTALTEEHISMLKKLSANIYLCLDGDKAGESAMLLNGSALENAGLNVKMINLSDDYDPDTYILKYGKESFLSLIDKASNYSDYKIEKLKKGINFNSDIELSNYINEVLKETSLINDDIRIEIILKKLANETKVSYNTLEKKLNEYKEKNSKKEKINIVIPKKEKDDKYKKASLGFIFYMLIDPKVISIYKEQELYFSFKEMRYLASEIACYYEKYGDIVIADFYTYLMDKKELLELFENILSINLSEEHTRQLIEDYVNVIKEYNMRQEIKSLEEVMKKETDDVKKAEIVEQMKKLKIGE